MTAIVRVFSVEVDLYCENALFGNIDGCIGFSVGGSTRCLFRKLANTEHLSYLVG